MKNPFKFMKARPPSEELFIKLESIAEPIDEYRKDEIQVALFLLLIDLDWSTAKLILTDLEFKDLKNKYITSTVRQVLGELNMTSTYKNKFISDFIRLYAAMCKNYKDSKLNEIFNEVEEIDKKKAYRTHQLVQDKEGVLGNLSKYITIHKVGKTIKVTSKKDLEEKLFNSILNDDTSIASFELVKDIDDEMSF